MNRFPMHVVPMVLGSLLAVPAAASGAEPTSIPTLEPESIVAPSVRRPVRVSLDELEVLLYLRELPFSPSAFCSPNLHREGPMVKKERVRRERRPKLRLREVRRPRD